MKIFINLLVIAGFGLALLITTRMFVMTNQEFHDNPELFLYERGSAPSGVRAEILEQLEYFGEGYLKRDTSVLESYMERLFSRENILILGTMPGEIYSGFPEAAELVSSDWLYWGDVNLLVESSNISVSDSVAWFSMIGNVKFDLSSLLDLPLRVSGVMVHAGDSWKFQQLQFQFDLDTQWVFLLIALLALMFLVSIIRLMFVIVRARARKRT